MLGEILTAIVTPFHENGGVNFDAFRALAGHLVDNGSDGLVVAATTGEAPTLTDEEKLELWKAAVEEVGGRATVIAGTGTYSTEHSIELTRKADDVGVDGFLVVTPYYNKPPQRGIVEHFRAISKASDKPIVVYNIPGRVVINIEPATMVELAEIPNVVAVKQANDDLDQARRIVEETELDLYAGDDFLVHPFLELGGVGGVCVRSNIAGPQFKEMVGLYREGDFRTATRINEELGPLFELDDITVNPIPIKTALTMLGHDVGGFRLPLVEATPVERERVKDCLERAGLLAAAPV
ncbi:MAG: 4-hydroxy-tetrahydrodipicolinate synthase [Actinobacteria bacterium]|nr:4-hydroxy-tetrahydrodipicolinate synthase [Actinomycetota bacterium]